MSSSNSTSQKFGSLPVIISGGVVLAALLAIFYYSGLYTEFRGMMKKAELWSGLFGTEIKEINEIDGPALSRETYDAAFSTPDGDQVKMDDYRGKVLFVNLWASWCLPCVAEMPTIETLYNNVSDNEDIKFMLISVDEKPEKAVAFMEEKGFPMPVYFPDSGLPDNFSGSGIPSTFVISKEGQIIYRKKGMADYSSDTFQNWLVGQTK